MTEREKKIMILGDFTPDISTVSDSTKIGVAVITRNRVDVIKKSYEMHCRNTKADKFFIIDDDSYIPVERMLPDVPGIIRTPEWVGVAASRNIGLLAIMDCDYIFLMDDDIFPITPGWTHQFINAHKAYPTQHVLYAHDVERVRHQPIFSPANSEGRTPPIMLNVESSLGAFLFITKEGVQRVGGYRNFGRYGYEDTDFKDRAFRAGLSPNGMNVTIPDCQKHLHMCDLHADFEDLKWTHRSVLHKEKDMLLQESRENFMKRDVSIIFHNPLD